VVDATLQQQHALACVRQFAGEGSAARARADDDDIRLQG
jgi:hypothetical protein